MGSELNQYASNSFSQFGEDGIIERIFQVLPAQPERWCVEFGAWDGKYLSNTHELIANRNWKGVLIEGNPRKFPDLISTYKNNPNTIPLNRLVSFEAPNTLDSILGETSIPVDFDFLSIDIDGNDYHIWASLQTYRPKVVVIEFNQTIPSDIQFVQAKDMNVNHGSSLRSMVELGMQKGYELVAATVNNAFFVRKEYFAQFQIADNSAASIWEKEGRAPRIFQLYDGTLVVSEKFKLIWHDKYVGQQDLQALPKVLRYFGDSTNVKGFYKKLLKKVYYRLLPERSKRL